MSGREVNALLREHGYLDGVPGNYSVTDKGRPYAYETDEFRGNPRSLAYSTSWSTRSWDEEIVDELKREMAESSTTAGAASPLDEGALEDPAAVVRAGEESEGGAPDWRVIAAVLLGVAGVSAARHPRVKRWVREQAQPRVEKLWDRATSSRLGGPHAQGALDVPATSGEAAPEGAAPSEPPTVGE